MTKKDRGKGKHEGSVQNGGNKQTCRERQTTVQPREEMRANQRIAPTKQVTRRGNQQHYLLIKKSTLLEDSLFAYGLYTPDAPSTLLTPLAII